MGLIDRIKEFWRNRNTKALPEAQQVVQQQQMKNPLFYNVFNGNNKKQVSQVDIDIERFLNAYYNNLQKYNGTLRNEEIAYSSLVRMNARPATTEEYNKNKNHELQLLDNLNFDKRYQYKAGGDFYHVQSQNYKMPPNEDIVRFYLDCNNGDIAELTSAILSFNQSNNFYLKFPLNEKNARHPRSEKIVIYCDKNEIGYIGKLLQYTKQVRPDLFKEANNKLPFLQNIEGIASIANQPRTNQYYDLYGHTRQISQSVNYFMSNILEESYMEASHEIAREDPQLTFLLNQESYYNESLYVNNFPYINANHHDYLLASMKAKMAVLSQRNGIYIEGITNVQQIAQTQKMQNLEQNNIGGYYESR